MMENETIELLRSMQNPKQDYADVVCAPAFCTGFRFVYPEPEDYAIEEAIKALEEIQQYRQIGTVEECREAVEKQKAKKPEVKDNMLLEITEQYRVRKLTPKECWRLMGFSDEDYEKAAEVNSKTQLYKQAGNSIVKDVLMAIFSQLNIKGVPMWNEVHHDTK